MNPKELDSYLRKETKSEKEHIHNPNILSKRYQHIPRIQINNLEMFEFSFDSVLKDANISIMKESRYAEIPLHRHKVIEINYVYSGKCTQIINNKEINLNQGDVCLLDRNTPHKILKMNENDILITIDMKKKYFTDGFLQKISTQGIVTKFLVNAIQDNTNEKQFIIFRTEDDDELRFTFERMISEYYSDDKTNEVIDAYMTIIFSKLLRIYKNKQLSNYQIDKSVLILEILQYLEKNYMNITLTDAANHFGFNPTYLSNYIKKQTGRTFKDLVIQKKMTTVCFYLVNTDIPIYEIAKEVGYDNLGFFYKKFKSIYHLNPQEYREQYK